MSVYRVEQYRTYTDHEDVNTAQVVDGFLWLHDEEDDVVAIYPAGLWESFVRVEE